MNDQEPEEVRFFWAPEISENPVDLAEYIAEHGPIPMTPQSVPLDTDGAEVVYFDELRAIEAIPEGTLTPVVLMDDEGAGTVGHAEVIHNEDGSRTLKIYGLHHNPEGQP